MPPSLKTISELPDYSRREAARNSPDINVRTDRAEALATIPPDVARKVRKILLLASEPRYTQARGDEVRAVIREASGLPVEPHQVYMGPPRLALEAISHILHPYGYGDVRSMEGETPRSCKGKTVYDLNTGDSYTPTVCYCDGRWYIAPPAWFLGD